MEAVDASALLMRPGSVAIAAGLAFLISFLTPLVIGSRLRRLAQEEPEAGIRPRRQWAASGLSITLALALPLLLLAHDSPEIRAAAIVAALGGMAGLLNDLFALRKAVLLLLALGIAAAGAAFGLVISEIKLPFTTQMIEFGAWAIPASMLWLLAVAYAVILLRRLPRLTAGVVVMVAATFAIAAISVGPSRSAPASAFLGVVMAGCSAGALRKDYPALGSAAHWAMGVPLLALGVPVGETTYGVIYRVGRGRERLALGQRWELLHEALIRTGLAPRRTVRLFHLATLYLCLLALALVLVVRITFVAKLGLLAMGLAFGFALFFMLARIWSEPVESAEERVDMFGVPLASISMDGALTRIDQFVEEGSPHLVVTSDTPSIVRAREDTEYQDIVREADMVTADGRGVVWMARVLGLPMTERVSGADLVQQICARAQDKGYRIYLLGAEPGVAEAAAEKLAKRCPGLNVVGTHHGYFTPEQEPEVVRRIAEARPDILLVALGAPRQEKWIRRHMAELQAPVAIGVGGTFDVLAGRAKRAPEWMQRAGLEWLYRAAREPSRLPRMWALPRLMWMTLWEALRKR
jgi:N-acetylglucosaminyldiphosphoundecaprenol N-acetyl-beta-D-mannosaminyltransferase